MRHLLETVDGKIFEVTNLFNENGDEVKSLHEAASVVVQVDDESWAALTFDGSGIYQLH